MERQVVFAKLQEAIDWFTADDQYLLDNDLSERCIASRLAMYLQAAFPDHDVDVEYNRAGEIAKRVPMSEECDTRENRDGNPLAVPDVIVHKRGPEGPNILVLELKKTSNQEGWNCDRERVHKFREHLDYEFGALIECETREWHDKSITIVEFVPN
jgi:hypothetical protein